MAYPLGGGFDFGPYLVEGWQGGWHPWGEEESIGLIKPEPQSAPILLCAFFKGSEVIKYNYNTCPQTENTSVSVCIDLNGQLLITLSILIFF